ncbi:MAG: serine/threonine protein kinase [Theionarchaea archaeon]|nr:MAG: hypothetical protein AYK19_16125 [Theionarchaea archaeon DG-70-1]MBU7029480.1 serine/threonine protein kinase [Theionarchaea archaeon]
MVLKENLTDNTESMAKDFYCHRCSRTVTEHAHTDGRAEELADVVLYLCDTCAKNQQKEADIDHIGEYMILHTMGKGGMSVVYKAWHEPTYRIVALKRILPEITVYEEAKRFFQREALIMQNLIHPNIVRLIDHKIGGEEFYFVLEYLPGGDLYTYVKRNSTSLTEVCRILCDILDGIDYVHGKGLVHGDIKPYNILMSHTGTGKLSDFNLARNFGELEISNPDRMSKTPVFMAPEEIVNIKNVGPAVDIYCMGISMYNIFTNRFPLTIPELNEMIKAFVKEKNPKDPITTILHHKKELVSQHSEAVKQVILKGDRVPVLDYKKDLPPELAQIIDKAVRKNKEDRFKSAREMKDALIAFLSTYEKNKSQKESP